MTNAQDISEKAANAQAGELARNIAAELTNLKLPENIVDQVHAVVEKVGHTSLQQARVAERSRIVRWLMETSSTYADRLLRRDVTDPTYWADFREAYSQAATAIERGRHGAAH